MTARAAFDKPFDVQIIEGEVVITGPGSLNASMTLAAAQESMRRLEAALKKARPRAARKTAAATKDS